MYLRREELPTTSIESTATRIKDSMKTSKIIILAILLKENSHITIKVAK